MFLKVCALCSLWTVALCPAAFVVDAGVSARCRTGRHAFAGWRMGEEECWRGWQSEFVTPYLASAHGVAAGFSEGVASNALFVRCALPFAQRRMNEPPLPEWLRLTRKNQDSISQCSMDDKSGWESVGPLITILHGASCC